MSLIRSEPRRLAMREQTDPFEMLRRQMDDLLSRYMSPEDGGTALALPSLDVSETDEAIEIKMDLPGIKREEIDVELRGDVLTIHGQRKEEIEEGGPERRWHRVERRSGEFARSVRLPASIDLDRVEARCEHGVLTVTLPKSEEEKPKHIEVKS